MSGVWLWQLHQRSGAVAHLQAAASGLRQLDRRGGACLVGGPHHEPARTEPRQGLPKAFRLRHADLRFTPCLQLFRASAMRWQDCCSNADRSTWASAFAGPTLQPAGDSQRLACDRPASIQLKAPTPAAHLGRNLDAAQHALAGEVGAVGAYRLYAVVPRGCLVAGVVRHLPIEVAARATELGAVGGRHAGTEAHARRAPSIGRT